jgi:hypothetical protein
MYAFDMQRRVTEAQTFSREIGEGTGTGDTVAAPPTERFFAIRG